MLQWFFSGVQFTLQVELHTGLIKAGASVGCDYHVRFVKLMTLPEYAVFYEKKYAEVSKHQHKRALALTARKLVRLIFGLLDKNQLYSAAKE